MLVVGLLLVLLPVLIGIYAYVLYPVILRFLPPNRSTPRVARATATPMVTVVIPAYNEELQIRGAIEAVLAQDYPAERRQVLVLSDASTDATDDIVRGYQTRGVELMPMPVRGGKTAAENASLSRIRGQLVINTDCSVRLHPNALRRLVAALADPTVGVASTRDVSIASVEGVSPAEASYVGFEMAIRRLETRSGGIVGASGSGYAIRTFLHEVRVRDDLSRDFSSALTAHRHGFRAVSVEDAICYVPRSASLSHEYRRKVRTISRGMETLYFNRDLLNPWVHGLFAWKLLSHKLCRWLLPLSALPALLGLVVLSKVHASIIILLIGGLGAGVLAFVGATWPDSRRVPRWLPVGLLGILAANLAVVHSTWRFFHGHEDHMWEPTRRVAMSA
jgi:cellulose synthase/poly-beta-1,6-N-acetylglucosamine synthase-like glycosyltransferase